MMAQSLCSFYAQNWLMVNVYLILKIKMIANENLQVLYLFFTSALPFSNRMDTN